MNSGPPCLPSFLPSRSKNQPTVQQDDLFTSTQTLEGWQGMWERGWARWGEDLKSLQAPNHTSLVFLDSPWTWTWLWTREKPECCPRWGKLTNCCSGCWPFDRGVRPTSLLVSFQAKWPSLAPPRSPSRIVSWEGELVRWLFHLVLSQGRLKPYFFRCLDEFESGDEMDYPKGEVS